MPPPPPKTVNITGVQAISSAGSLASTTRRGTPSAQANSYTGSTAINIFNQFIFDMQTLSLRYKIGLIGYADPSSANCCGSCPHMNRLIYGMIQLVYLDDYNTDELWNFQYARYAANNNWRPWPF